MRARRSGAIVNISTIGVQIQPAGSGHHAASKAALEGLSGEAPPFLGLAGRRDSTNPAPAPTPAEQRLMVNAMPLAGVAPCRP
jgi:NAD(P)-dependent dehydrogenase (short-subunit alcohol dehydrogenase family)